MQTLLVKKVVDATYLNQEYNAAGFKQFNKFNNNNKKTYIQTTEYSLEDEFGLNVNTLDDVKRILGRNWKQLLMGFGPFLNHIRTSCYRKDHYVVERPLSGYNACLLKYYGEQQTVRNYIQRLMELNVIKDVSPLTTTTLPDGSIAPYVINREDFYKYGIPNLYIFNPLEIENLINIVKQFDPNWNKHRVYSVIKKRGSKGKEEILKKYQNKCWFGRKLRVAYTAANRNALICGLRENYKHMDYFCGELADEVNNSDLIEFKNVYCPKINLSKSHKSIIGFGIRNTNYLCNHKNDENEEGCLSYDEDIGYYFNESTTNERYRDETLKELWNVDHYYKYDVKSSILRVMYLLEHGEWLNDNVDLHQMLFDYKFESKEDRKRAKRFDLIFTFTTSVDDFISKQRFALYKDGLMIKTGAYTYKATQELKDELVKFDNNMREIFGLYRDIGSEIFYHESNIYLMVQKRIQKELGIKYEVVYDCFYSPDEKITQIQSIVKECALEYYNNYLNNNCYIKKPTTIQNSINNSSVNVGNVNNNNTQIDKSSEKTDMYITTKVQNTSSVSNIVPNNNNNSINKETDSSEKTDMYIITKVQNTNHTTLDYDETMKRFYEQINLQKKELKRVSTMDDILI